MAPPILYVGMDVHKDFVVIAVFQGRRQEPLLLERVPFDAHSRREELDQQIEALALTPAYQPFVARLRCFRALDTHSAMVLATEVGDWRRFDHVEALMAYFGLVPSEHSSGDRRHLGAITKAGNSHCRHVLVQGAWSYRHRTALGTALRARQRGQDPAVIAHAWKAQHRCYKLFHRIAAKRPSQIAAVAVARELVGFLWAVMQEVRIEEEAVQEKHAA